MIQLVQKPFVGYKGKEEEVSDPGEGLAPLSLQEES